jgi:hypothetical protein
VSTVAARLVVLSLLAIAVGCTPAAPAPAAEQEANAPKHRLGFAPTTIFPIAWPVPNAGQSKCPIFPDGGVLVCGVSSPDWLSGDNSSAFRVSLPLLNRLPDGGTENGGVWLAPCASVGCPVGYSCLAAPAAPVMVNGSPTRAPMTYANCIQ